MAVKHYVDVFAPCRAMVFDAPPPLPPPLPLARLWMREAVLNASAHRETQRMVQARRLLRCDNRCPCCRKQYRYSSAAMCDEYHDAEPHAGLAMVQRLRLPVAFHTACNHVVCNHCFVHAMLNLIVTVTDHTATSIPGGAPRLWHQLGANVGEGDALALCPICSLRMRAADAFVLGVVSARDAHAWAAHMLRGATPDCLAAVDEEIARADGEGEDIDDDSDEEDGASLRGTQPVCMSTILATLRYKRSLAHATGTRGGFVAAHAVEGRNLGTTCRTNSEASNAGGVGGTNQSQHERRQRQRLE